LATLDYGYYRPIENFINVIDKSTGKVLADNLGLKCPYCGTGHLHYAPPEIPNNMSSDAKAAYVLGDGGAEKNKCDNPACTKKYEYTSETFARLSL
jgi:hypothetical protein